MSDATASVENANHLVGVVHRAFEHARTGDLPDVPMLSSRLRSRRWVQSLAAEFRLLYREQPDVRVMCQADDLHRKELGLNELLFDVLVCRVSTVQTPRHHTATYVREAVWQVESEFARDTVKALQDFSKLVLGAAPLKLFVAPFVGRREEHAFLEALTFPALACTGEVFLAQLPHPAKWAETELSPSVSVFQGTGWQSLSAQEETE